MLRWSRIIKMIKNYYNSTKISCLLDGVQERLHDYIMFTSNTISPNVGINTLEAHCHVISVNIEYNLPNIRIKSVEINTAI